MLTDVVLLIGVVAAVVLVTSGIMMTSGRLFKVAIVNIPATHVATSITNQITILQALL